MPHVDSSDHIRIVRAGTVARDILLSGEPLSVFAAFERSFYLGTSSGRLVCLGQKNLASGPLMALCAPWPGVIRMFTVGDRVERTEHGLRIGSCVFHLDTMSVWTPRPFPACSFSRIRLGLSRLPLMELSTSPSMGFAPLLPHILSSGSCPPSLTCEAGTRLTTEAYLRREAWNGLEMLRNWLVTEDMRATENLKEGVRTLLGLGPGLTPSGDDALAGMLLALSALQMQAARGILAAVIEEQAPGATNAISRAHLCAAASGQGAAPVLDTICAVMEGVDSSLLKSALQQLNRIGHSSGWDAFTGIVLTLVSLSEARG